MSSTEQRLLFFIGSIVVAIGLYVSIGWFLVNPAMIRIIPGSPVMVFNTAVCFVVSGIWFILKSALVFDNTSRSSCIFGSALAFALIILPTLVFIEIMGNFNLGIDWVERHNLILDRNASPGRMAPNTCIAFVLIGSAFLFDRINNLRIKKIAFIVLGGAHFFWVFPASSAMP